MTGPKRHAKHSRHARNDKIAVARITDWITSSDHAVPNIESYNTWPNYDGQVDLIDEQEYTIGTLLVQVKKLPEQHHLAYTFKDEGRFLAYCKEHASWIPILFIGVDLKKNRAYWLHMSEVLVHQLGDSQTIHLKADQSFSAEEQESIRSWHTVVARYADIARERTAFEEQLRNLQQKIESNLIGANMPEFLKLPMFLDEYNRLLDQDLSIVKKVYYPNAWEIGIAYAEYTSTILSYFLYPIQPTANEVAIKKLNPDTFKPLQPAPPGSTWHLGNPLEKNPQAYAKELVRERLNSILRQKLLDHAVSLTLAREYIFAYVDKYTEQLGLSEKNRYTVTELEAAFTDYYPRWLVEAQKVLLARNGSTMLNSAIGTNGSRFILYNPDRLSNLDQATRQEIQGQVALQIAARLPRPMIVIAGDKLSSALFAGMLDFVKHKGIKSVARLYKPRDLSYFKSTQSSYSWDLYSPAARLYNTKRLVVRLQTVYDKIVSGNFPQIAHQLALVKPGHRLLYVYDSSQNAGGPNEPQGATAYIIADKATWNERPTFLLASEHTIVTTFCGPKWLLSIDGEEYELVSILSGTGADSWNTNTPLLDMIYQHLERALDAYFKQ